MSTKLERRPSPSFRRFDDWFDLPDLWSPMGRSGRPEMIRVEESMGDGMLTIRAEMPGIDPDKDVEITVGDGLLTITAERRTEDTGDRDGATFSEFSYGSFSRTLRLPTTVDVDDVKATYQDGILTIEVPMPEPAEGTVTKVPVTRT